MADTNRQPSLITLLINVVMIAYGIHELHNPRGRFSHAFGIIWIVLGAGLLLLGLLVRIARPDKAAQRVDDLERELWSTDHPRKILDASAIRERKLDVGFYEQTTAELQSLGYRKLEDYVDLTAEKAAPWAVTLLRALLSRDGTVMAGVYQVRLRSWARLLQLIGVLSRKMQVIDMDTELSDGTFITTGNEPMAGKTAEVPGISRLIVPHASVPQMQAAHTEHVARTLAVKPGVTPLRFASFADLCKSQDRLQALKSKFRASPQFDKVKEIETMAGRSLSDEELAMAVEADELRRNRLNNQ